MSTLTYLYRHHRWANLALIDALAALPAETLTLTSPGTYGTIHRTPSHMVEGEQCYLATLKGVATIVAQALPDELPPLATLRAAAERQANDLIAIAGQLIETSTGSGTFKGRPFEMPAFVPLCQAYGHAVEHRADITTTLAAHGHPPFPRDLWPSLAAGMPWLIRWASGAYTWGHGVLLRAEHAPAGRAATGLVA